MRENPMAFLFAKTWQYSLGSRSTLRKAWLLLIAGNVMFHLFSPLVAAKMMDVIQKQGITSQSIWILLGVLSLMFVIEIAFWIFHGPGRILERQNSFKIASGYRMFHLSGVMNLPLAWHTDHHTGDTIDKVEKGAGALRSFSEDSFEPLSMLVMLIVGYIMLTVISPISGLIVFVMMVLAGWIIIRFDRVMVPQFEELNRAENRVSQNVIDAITNITTIIILRAEHLILKAISRQLESPYALYQNNIRLNEYKWCAASLASNLTACIVMGTYFLQHVGSPQGASVATAYLIWEYLKTVCGQFQSFAGMYGNMVRHKAAMLNSAELSLDFRPSTRSTKGLPGTWSELSIRKLNFSYHTKEGADLHLENVSLSVRRGAKVALVGGSGSGKTTLLMIMDFLYLPGEMDLFLDDQELTGGFGDISESFALIPQMPEILTDTIMGNITMGADWGLNVVRHYTDLACLTDTIERLPHGFESSIKEKGVNLSGGERQRLALARGLLACRDKDVILLDEPTSSMDPANELQVHENIFREFADKTIISTVHKLHLLPFFDYIYIFGKARIVAQGTLAELMTSSVEFQNLWYQYHKGGMGK